MAIHRKHKGTQNELVACVWLLGQGYEVYRNVSPYGEIDVIAIKGDELLRLDVKTGIGRLSESQLKNGVHSLHVMPNGSFEFDVFPSRKLFKLICKNCKQEFEGDTTRKFC